ncbi:MAG: glutathione S-transferase family protein [Trueperaceae bacterium]|nr:glutathione S-transferase family protein [Trueperaceae bacterium]
MTEPRPVLFSSARSPHCFKVSLVLHEKGVDFERVEIDLPAREQKTPAFLALNPLGQVPVYADEAGVHVDSLVIMRHLDRQHPEPSLFPADATALADALAWIELSSTAMRDVSHHLYWQLIEPPEAGPDPARVATLKAEGLTLLARVEAALDAGDGWLVGGSLGAADLSVFAWLYGYARFDLPTSFDGFEHVADWRARIAARPSFEASFGRRGRPFATWLAERAATAPPG